MPIYTYQAKKGPSKVVRGQLDAENRQEAIAVVNAAGLFLLSLDEKRVSGSARRVGLKQLVDFTRQLSTLINAGSPLLAALVTLLTQTETANLKPIIADIVAQVKDGHDFSHAIAKYPRTFGKLYVALVHIGETSGTLGENLSRLAEFLEEELELKANVSSILVYPSLICAVGVVTVAVLIKFVIPRIAVIFTEIGQNLPLPTHILVNAAAFFSRWGLLVALIGAAVVIGLRAYCARPAVRRRLDELRLTMPLAGALVKTIHLCRFSRTLHTLLNNGVSMDAALKTAAETMTNTVMAQEILRLEELIQGGSSLAEAMKASRIFPPAFINVVTVGEDSGQLPAVLATLSRDYAKDINRMIKSLVSLLEPALILGVGLVVGFVVLSMLLPIFQIDFNV